MKMPPFALGLLVASAINAAVAMAQPPAERAAELTSDNATSLLPLTEAIAAAENRFAGRVIDAEIKPGRPAEQTPLVFELRLLTDVGNVLKIRLDARNGDFLDAEGHGLADARRRP